MYETFYIFIGLILYTIAAIAFGFVLGKYRGEEIGLRNGGVLTGKDAKRFHKKMDKLIQKENERNKYLRRKT